MDANVTTSTDEIQEMSLSTIIKKTFQIYGKGFYKLSGVVVITMAIIWGALWLWAMPLLFDIGTPTATAGLIVGAILIAILSGILYVWMYGVLIHLSSVIFIGKESRIGTSMVSSWKRLLAMIGAGLVLALIVFGISIILSLLMMIPLINIIVFIILIPVGIYFSIRLAFIMQAVFIEGASPIESLSRSSELVHGNWWHTFGYMFALGIISTALLFAIYFILFFNVYVGQIVATVVVTPIGLIGTSLLYWDLRARNEKCSIEKVAAELNVSD